MKRGALVRLLPDWQTESYPLRAVMPSGRFVPARVRALVDFLALKFQDVLAGDVESLPAPSPGSPAEGGKPPS